MKDVDSCLRGNDTSVLGEYSRATCDYGMLDLRFSAVALTFDL